MLPLKHRGFWWAASAVLVLVVVWGSLQTRVDLGEPAGFDKVEHLGTYLVLALWFTGMVPRGRYGAVVAALLGLGASMEIGQYLMHAGRQADVYDMAANALGIVTGVIVALRGSGGWMPKVEAWLR